MIVATTMQVLAHNATYAELDIPLWDDLTGRQRMLLIVDDNVSGFIQASELKVRHITTGVQADETTIVCIDQQGREVVLKPVPLWVDGGHTWIASYSYSADALHSLVIGTLAIHEGTPVAVSL